ncbi:condensation domain protein [Mycobacterium xenopi 3993]|nr:condensation domain protein [Mycobacterium xenopi 3993]
MRACACRWWRVDAVGCGAARLTQQQIDQLEQRYRIADVLPLTPLQQGLLFHASTAQGDDDLYVLQLELAVAGPLDPDRLRAAVQLVVSRHPNLVSRVCDQFDEPVQVILADPAPGGAMSKSMVAASMNRSRGCARPSGRGA